MQTTPVVGELAPMQVIQSVSGTFWHFDLANELEPLGYLKRIYSTYPWVRLQREGIPRERVRTFPWIHGPLMASGRYIRVPSRLSRRIELVNIRLFDEWVASQIEECDAFIGLSGSGLKTGRVVQSRGGKHICDRGSSHIRYQDRILQDEFERWGFQLRPIDPQVISREEAEYASADTIFVPSTFAHRSFVEMGVPSKRVKTIPYGVRLDRFRPAKPLEDETFEVLFAGTVSLRKGIPYLLDAFRRLRHPHKRLRLAGPVEPEMKSLLSKFDLTGVEVLGRMLQTDLARCMSTTHVLVLPSIEDGFGLVMAQAMACGAVVVSSEHTGGADLYQDGVEGFIVPIRSPGAIVDRLQRLADDPHLLSKMREATLNRVRSLGGWHDYGQKCVQHLRDITGKL
jgi:glycosyltransferase involved in cell wall biosynthesis